MTRAVVYARVSSQAQRDRHTIASQLTELPRFVAAQGWELVRPAGHYIDDGRTAKAGHLEDRPAFARLLRDAAAGEFDVVAVVDLDRLSRSEDLAERGQILGAFQRAGVALAITSSGQVLDLRSSMGDLFAGLQLFFAADENRKRRERTVRGKLEAIRRGRKPAGPSPFWLAYDRATGAWSFDPARAPVVRRMCERALTTSIFRISEELDEAGAPRPRGGRWNRDRVFRILTSSALHGEWIVDKARNLTIQVPALISREAFDAIQAALASRRSYKSVPRSRLPTLLEGISLCELCGGRIRIVSSRHGRRYTCITKTLTCRELAGAERCPNPMQLVDQVDARVWGELLAKFRDRDFLEQLLGRRRLRGAEDGKDWAAEVRLYEKKLARYADLEADMLRMRARNQISQDGMMKALEGYARDRALLERNLDLARAELGRAARSKAELAIAAETIDALRDRIERASPAERRDIMRFLVPGRDGTHVAIGPRKIQVVGEVEWPTAAAPAVSSLSLAGSSKRQSGNRVRLVIAA